MKQVFQAERIFDGDRWHEKAALEVEDGRVIAITPAREGCGRVAGWLVPGLIDLQVNGGGGVLFNNQPDVAGIATICAGHAGFGTTAVMVTLITDTPDMTRRAIEAGAAAEGEVPGFLGLHLEGPHIALARKGTHDPALIRPMAAADRALVIEAAARLSRLIVTLAPEVVGAEDIAALVEAGAIVSLGHSDCDTATAQAAARAGASMVTHLFNAMSQFQHRAPGLVGAALDEPGLRAGLIADGFHVDDLAMRVALRAKPEGIFLVSDAMSTIGTDLPGFTLNGRQINRRGGRLVLGDSETLAGADIALIDAVRHCVEALGLPLTQALRLASLHPAEALGLGDRGHLRPGARADFVAISHDIRPLGTWIGGQPAVGAAS